MLVIRDRAIAYGIPEEGLTITFRWNQVALARLLDALAKEYPAGFEDMADRINRATARPPCGALWTHCALGCFTSCNHNDPCEHP